jgi:hydroxypyruvate reductase
MRHRLNPIQLRIAAREMFEATLRAADPGDAVRKVVHNDGVRLSICDVTIEPGDRKVYSIAIGKAATKMALALEEILGERLNAGVITTGRTSPNLRKDEQPSAILNRYTVFNGGHPEPNDQSLAAARASFDLLDRANEERALVVFLISGGGSAMIEWPISVDISLADLRTANQALVNCGASIAEINSVRRTFSAVKGGRLAARAANCDQVTLIVSDVPKGQEWSVASGPTIVPPKDAPDALGVIDKYALRDQLPQSIVRVIESDVDPAAEDSRQFGPYFVLLDNEAVLEAAAESARQRGFIAEIASDISDQPIEDGCNLLLNRLEQLRAKHGNKPRNRLEAGLVPPVGTSADSKLNRSAVCLISGGEFACPVRGEGIGGRNLETALRLACTTNSSLSHTVALCAGTDGIDGNSPAAGAIVDSTTFDRAKKIGLEAEDFLRRSDSYSFFVALGDVVATGATGTNVRDIRILLAAD